MKIEEDEEDWSNEGHDDNHSQRAARSHFPLIYELTLIGLDWTKAISVDANFDKSL